MAKKYWLKSDHDDDDARLLASGEIDAVYVATPNFLHTPYVVPALDAGMHVLLEKPMATSEADCQAVAFERALQTGQLQKLQPYERTRRPERSQVRTLKPLELIHTEVSSEVAPARLTAAGSAPR